MKTHDHLKYDVTVAVIHRNMGTYLRKALDSVLAQNLGTLRMEVVVLDDGSDDEHSLKEWDSLKADLVENPDVRFFARSPRAGIACMRNFATRLAHAPILMFVDADDWVGSGYVKTLHDGLNAASAAWATISCYVKYFDEQLGGERAGQQELCTVDEETAKELGSFSAYRTAGIQRMGGWAEGFDLAKGDEGYEFATRLRSVGADWVSVEIDENDTYTYRQRKLPDSAGLAHREVRKASIEWSKIFAGNHITCPRVRRPAMAIVAPPKGFYPDFVKIAGQTDTE